MSIEILGNNSFNVPLLDVTANTWGEGINQCDPLFKGLAIAGLSAVYDGIKQSPESQVLDTLEFGELFDDTGKFVGDDLYPKMHGGWHPAPPHFDRFIAGVHVLRAAFTASRLFRTLDVISNDYVGQTRVGYIRRRIELPVRNPAKAGKTMNAYPEQNIQARISTLSNPGVEHSFTQLDFAASLYSSGTLPWSRAITLEGGFDTQQQTASAKVTSGARQGDFIRVNEHVDFGDLSRWAEVADENL